MLRDENLYPDAEAFKPERFLEKTTPDLERRRNPRDVVFGFGRRCVSFVLFFRNASLSNEFRQCPGMHLVESSVWLLIASLLATFKISKAVDEHGNVVEPEVKYENPIFRYEYFSPCESNADMVGIQNTESFQVRYEAKVGEGA